MIAIETRRQKLIDEPPNEDSYTPESRVEMYDEIERKKEEDKKNEAPNPYKVPDEYIPKPMKPPPVYREDGTIRMANQGNYKFKIWEEEEENKLFLELQVPKFMPT